MTKLFQKRIGKGSEEAAGQSAAGLDLAADRAFGEAGVGAVLLLEEPEDLPGAVEHRGRHAGKTGITFRETSQITPNIPIEPAMRRDTS